MIEQILSYRTLFFNIDITITYAFSHRMSKSFHATFIKICTSEGDSCCCDTTAEMHHSPPHCAHVYCWSPSTFSKHQWRSISDFFCMEEVNSTLLLHTHSMSDGILSDCLSPAICQIPTQCNKTLAGRVSFYCHTGNICLT